MAARPDQVRGVTAGPHPLTRCRYSTLLGEILAQIVSFLYTFFGRILFNCFNIFDVLSPLDTRLQL